jgi:hypothetical protein
MDKSKQGKRVCTSQPRNGSPATDDRDYGLVLEGTYYYGHRACGCRDLGSMVSITEFWDACMRFPSLSVQLPCVVLLEDSCGRTAPFRNVRCVCIAELLLSGCNAGTTGGMT